jgi:hypothetical protein
VREEFYIAAVPEPTRILGVKLLPLSIGHLILLNRIESAFVSPGQECSIEDLALSILICSLNYKDGLALFEDTGLPSFMLAWHDKIAGVSWLTKIGIKQPIAIDFKQKSLEFSEYISRHSKAPFYSYGEGDFQSTDCPPVQIVRVSLMKELGISDEQIMDRPWALCLWDFITLKALAGHVKIINRADMEEKQAMADKIHDQIMKARANAKS